MTTAATERRDRAARLALLAALVVGAALRLYPIWAPYMNPDQELLPTVALRAFARDDWEPGLLQYPSGFTYLLRVTYTIAYGVARALGQVDDRIDVIAAYLTNPFPFFVVARLWACLAGIATIVLTARLGALLFDARSGGLAALFIAVAFLAVRESHYGSLDAPATAFFTATLVAVGAYQRSPGRARLVWAGVLAGLAAALRYQMGIVALALPTAVLLTPGSRAGRARDLALAALASGAVFAAATPYSILSAQTAWLQVRAQLALSWANRFVAPPGLPLRTALAAAVGPVVCGLAVVGLATAVRRRPRPTAPILAVAVPYALTLATAERSFVRYALPLVPIVSVLAAGAVGAITSRIGARARPAVAALLVAGALTDPALRSIELCRLLAAEDTRVAAGRWLAQHVVPGRRVWFPSRSGYANPTWDMAFGFGQWTVGKDLEAAARERQKTVYPPVLPLGAAPTVAQYLRQRGGTVVTADHPLLPHWASTPPSIRKALQERGATMLARFDGLGTTSSNSDVLYEPIDANFIPLRGLQQIVAPGPAIVVWRVDPEPRRSVVRPQ